MMAAMGKPLEDCGEMMAYPLLQPDFHPGSYVLGEDATPAKPMSGVAKYTDDEATCAGVWQKSVEIFNGIA